MNNNFEKQFNDNVEFITYQEAIRTSQNVNNQVTSQAVLNNMIKTAKEFDKIRRHFNTPIRVNSFFRSNNLNKIIGGSSTSAHTIGNAIDIDAISNVTNKQIFDWIRDNIDYDQLIWEFGNEQNPDWIHAGFSNTRNRKQVLRAVKRNNRTTYINM